MKTWKNCTFVVCLAIIVITFALIACDGGNSAEHTHEWSNWIETKASTVTEEGEETRTCTTCGETETHSISKLIGCTCPEGTTHYEGEPCCEGVNCECVIIVRKILFLNTEQTLRITLEYYEDGNNIPEHIAKIVSAADEFANRTSSGPATTKEILLERNLNYKIIVEYNDTEYNEFVAKDDGQTITVHNTWLLSDYLQLSDTDQYAYLRNSLYELAGI
jgi:hypothetical protein